jgi:hypothetical protein
MDAAERAKLEAFKEEALERYKSMQPHLFAAWLYEWADENGYDVTVSFTHKGMTVDPTMKIPVTIKVSGT